jgi:PAS domain S-box-containing protein
VGVRADSRVSALADRVDELTATVLVAEDEAVVALDLCGALERIGYEVRHMVHSGEDAVAAVQREPVDVALLDIRMPGALDGLDAGWELSSRHGIPVVYVTAHNDESMLARAKASGPFGFLVKPIDERALRTTIELALYRHQVERLQRAGVERYQTLFGSNPAAQFVCSRDGTILECNPAFARILGFESLDTAMELAVLPAEIMVPDSSRTIEALEANGIVEGVELNLTHRDGGLVRVIASAQIRQVRLGMVSEIHWAAIPLVGAGPGLLERSD